MRHIERLPEPEILRREGKRWLEEYLQSGEQRPKKSRYAHPMIKQTLENMSHTKCFYCEASLKEIGEHVDHHIEVSVNNELAYDWSNLYLSCPDCNYKKRPHNEIPVAETLDPIADSDDEIRKHIAFDCETIYEVKGSEKGLNTIRKYHLDSVLLDNRRRAQIQKLHKTIIKCLEKGGIGGLTSDDKNTILRYISPTSPFSYMCECYLREEYPYVFH